MTNRFEEQSAWLRANGWLARFDEPLWRDPIGVSWWGARLVFSRAEALRIQQLRAQFAPLYALGWRIAGVGSDEAPLHIREVFDPMRVRGQRRICSLRSAQRREQERGRLAR